jgi:hypothetical protein
VIVVPQLSEVPSGLPPSVAAIVQWLRRQRAQGDPLLVGVCVGAEVLAKADLLDGRPAYSPGGAAPIRRSRPAPADVVGLLSAGYRWDRPRPGVLLSDGIGKVEVASAFRPYTEPSYLASPLAVTADGLDLPEGLTPVYLHDQPGFAFDGALRDIARTRDVATARWVAKTLQYPTTDPRLSGRGWPWGLTLRPILIAAAAIAAVLGVQHLRRRGGGGDDARAH